jgi:tRNA-splicing ligase RtcB
MQVIKDEGAAPIKAWVDMKPSGEGLQYDSLLDKCYEDVVPNIEDSALTQLKNLARLPPGMLPKNGIAVMPDVHAGIGSTVGTVIALRKAVIPAAVGVDIGCGMVAVRTSLLASDLPDNLAPVRAQIERDIPVGFGVYQREEDIHRNWQGRLDLFVRGEELSKEFSEVEMKEAKVSNQLGTLGGGNHFIEICLDEKQQVWIMLHSGSRGTGNIIGKHFIGKAKEQMEQMHITLPDPDLAYLVEGGAYFADYRKAVSWAQEYAKESRAVMLERTIAALRRTIPKEFTIEEEAINCHHNYVEQENHFGENLYVTRKGAVRARAGDLGIIPGSMGQRSYIVRGKGNPESYCSCSHGAGRVMSRKEAGRRFTVEDLKAQTAGVECRKDAGVIDEIPGAYKSIDAVMDNQKDLVEVVAVLKQVLCVKG